MGEKLQAIDKHWIFVLANYYLKVSNIYNPYLTKTAGELIFDGYDDPILDIMNILNFIAPINVPFKKVGWLFGVIKSFIEKINNYLSILSTNCVRILKKKNYKCIYYR